MSPTPAPPLRAETPNEGASESSATAPFVRVALVGRPNSGKSSLYNALTGGDAHVGNFPGITVDVLESEIDLGDRKATVSDLPGLYSIDAVVDPSTDEGVARTFLDRAAERGERMLVLQVIDATQLALGLRLTRELLRAKHVVVVVATQKDVLEGDGRSLDVAQLARAIDAPVVHVNARDVDDTRRRVIDALKERLAATRTSGISEDFDPTALAARVVVERDPTRAKRRSPTARADAVLLHPAFGPIVFVCVMTALFAAVFLVADPMTSLMDAGVGLARARLSRWLGEGLLASFVADGVLGGAGTVLAFMPQIVILTVAMELMEASGYLARGAFLVDRLLRVLGLSGRSFLPLLMGHACAVPAIAATRIIRDPRERLTTILVVPLMTCSARVPTYALIIGTFFAARGAWTKAGIFVVLYFAGILSGLVASLVLRRSATSGRTLPLVLEMPQYRAPQARVVARKAWQSASRFFRDVGTVIVAVSAVLWALLTIPLPASLTSAPPDAPAIERSVAAGVGRALEPVTKPLGFDWRINVGLIGSFGAREVMVGTMGVIFGVEDASDDPAPLSERMREAKRADGAPAYSTRTALALLAFFVIACQCMSTVAAIRRETKSIRWPAFVLAYTYIAAYAVALGVHAIAGMMGVS